MEPSASGMRLTTNDDKTDDRANCIRLHVHARGDGKCPDFMRKTRAHSTYLCRVIRQVGILLIRWFRVRVPAGSPGRNPHKCWGNEERGPIRDCPVSRCTPTKY